jgi:BirA family biotin operon repressor/biotin-[acetyl-CoA-carboxylase] ligase
MGSEMKRERLDESKIQSHLSSGYWRVKALDEVASTQDLLKVENVRAGNVIVAEYQSKGRGRLDRSFEVAPSGGLLFSFYIEPKRQISDWGWIPLLVGMVVAETLNEQTHGSIFTTKWPNDVLGARGKVTGILAETYGSGVIVGVGINVSLTEEELPVPTASSIFLESGIELDRNLLLPSILDALSEVFNDFDAGDSLLQRYLGISSTIDKQVEVSKPNGEVVRATAKGISSSGGLVLDSGETVTVGDVVHLRS